METYSAREIAAEIRKQLPGVRTKKLHKLLYYCQGFHIAALDQPLFREEIQAWDRGPVVADLWCEEKYGAPLKGGAAPTARLDQAALNTVGYVLSRYGAMTGADLESLTHNEPPWQVADQRRKLTGAQRLELNEIIGYFKSAAARDEEPFDSAFDDARDNYEPAPDAIHAWLADAEKRKAEHLEVDDLTALDDLIKR
jgi:uncharacterized phage-associated protein